MIAVVGVILLLQLFAEVDLELRHLKNPTKNCLPLHQAYWVQNHLHSNLIQILNYLDQYRPEVSIFHLPLTLKKKQFQTGIIHLNHLALLGYRPVVSPAILLNVSMYIYSKGKFNIHNMIEGCT